MRRTKRKIIIGLLAVGTIAGFASGFAHLGRGHAHDRARHAAEVCVDAALAETQGDFAHRPPRIDHMERRVAELCADEARRRRPAT
jgi:hypothetical protein